LAASAPAVHDDRVASLVDGTVGRAGAVPSREAADARGAPQLPLGPTLVYLGGLAVFWGWGLYGPFLKTLVVGLFLVGALTRRPARFVRDWAVFLAGIALFYVVRAAVSVAVGRLEPPLYMGYVIRMERALFGGETLPTLVQAATVRRHGPGLVEYVLVGVHAAHFVIFLLCALGLWLVRPAGFGRFTAAMLLVMAVGDLTYLALPTVPPWMAADFQAIPPIQRVADEAYRQLVPGLRRTFDTNPVAAMPSLHAAFDAVSMLVAFHHFGAWGWLVAAYFGLACWTAVALGEHYFLDLVAGGLLAGAVYWLLYRSPWLAAPARRDRRMADSAAAVADGGAAPARRRLVLAGALLLLAAGVGQATLYFRRPFTPSDAFVRRELQGRRDLAPRCHRC
jgi:hypothetical protein